LLGKSRLAPVPTDGMIALRVEPDDIMLFPRRHDLLHMMS
jgi:hypothetical protein